jgi:transcription elongation factor Elf1
MSRVSCLEGVKMSSDELREIDLSLNDQAVCPHCGHVHESSHEFFDNKSKEGRADTVHCRECGDPFDIEFEVVYYFTTRKPKEAT